RRAHQLGTRERKRDGAVGQVSHETKHGRVTRARGVPHRPHYTRRAIEYRDSVTPQQGMSKYETGVLLGSGGMASCYRARDPLLGRPVALKFLRRDDPILVERLLREARAQAKVEHELVCKVYEVGTLGDRAYIAMQLIDGERLDAAAPKLSLEEK